MRRFGQLLLLSSYFLALRLVAQPLNHQTVIVLPHHTDQISLQGNLSYFRDSLGTKTIAEVSRPANDSIFRPVTSPVPNFGVTTGIQTAKPIWLRFRMQNPASQVQSWLAEIGFWCFDELQLFIVDDAGRLLSTSPVIGWKTPATERMRHHRYFWFPFSVSGSQHVTAYLRVLKRRGTQIVPIELIRESAYESTVQKSYLFWGVSCLR